VLLNGVSNLVVVQKPDGRIRLCVDLRAANKAVITDGYPLPRIEELLHSMKNCSVFSKLDLSEAYLQLTLHESSRDLTAFVTPDGLFRFKRCPFGLASCPSAFQAVMSQMLSGIPGVACYLDDIVISGESHEEHEKRLEEVLRRLEKHNVKLNKNKCVFRQKSITYLGYEISCKKIVPSPKKVKALVEAPPPTSLAELRTVLGAFGYYARYIPNFSSLVEPLRCLLKETTFKWNQASKNAFEKLKEMISSSSALAPFDVSLPVIVSSDASDVGLGAVLSVVDPVLGQRTVEFASKTLTAAERKFSTTEKESYALVWACEKWRPYLLGRKFTLETDHEPLRMIFSTKGLDRMSLRIARWAVRLMAFNFDIKYKRGAENTIPDFFSRFPIQDEDTVFMLEEDEEDTSILNEVTVSGFQMETDSCPELAQLKNFLQTQWPQKKDLNSSFKTYSLVKDELSIHNNCVFRGKRLVAPIAVRKELIEMAHHCHPGITKTKTILRSQYWWPGMDKDTEEAVKNCIFCTQSSKSFRSGPPPERSTPLPLPNLPWERLAIDIKGPMYDVPSCSRYAIVIIDLLSKWPEVFFVSSVDTESIIKALKTVFAREGLPSQILSDNGPQFTSQTFKLFVEENNITHVRSPLYCPQTNGVVERFNRTLSEQVEIAKLQKLNIKYYIQDFLQMYRATPHSTTACSPSLLLHGREMQSKITHLSETLKKKKKTVRFRDIPPFVIGDNVCLKYPRTGKIRRGFVITKLIGSRSVILNNGEKWHTNRLSLDRSGLDAGTDDEEDDLPDWSELTRPGVETSSLPPLSSSRPMAVPGPSRSETVQDYQIPLDSPPSSSLAGLDSSSASRTVLDSPSSSHRKSSRSRSKRCDTDYVYY